MIKRRLAAAAGMVVLALPPYVSAGDVRPSCHGLAATIAGTEEPENVFGTKRPDVIVGRGGRDRIYGGGGRDVICAGRGDDWVYAEDGNDLVFGNEGADELSGMDGRDSLRGGSGDDQMISDTSDDPPEGDAAFGGPGADVCINARTARTCERTRTHRTRRVAVSELTGMKGAPINDATGAGDVDGDGEVDLLLGSYYGAGGAGLVTLLLGPLDDDKTVSVSEERDAVRIRGAQRAREDPDDRWPRGDRAHLVAAGDVNGDGLSDVVVGAPGSETSANDGGRAYVIFGRHDLHDVDLGDFDSGRQGDSGFTITGSNEGLGMAMSIAFLGDVNGDRFGDVAVGWRGTDTYVIFGKADGEEVDLRLFDLGLQGDAGYRIQTGSSGNRYGVDAAGDVDGDGLDDVLVWWSEWYEHPEEELGYELTETWISYGKTDSGYVDSAELDRTGTRIQPSVEERVSRGIGDFNGDGFDDVLFLNTPSIQVAKVLLGGPDLPGQVSAAFGSPLAMGPNMVVNSWVGPAAALGDVDGDGLSDFAFGAETPLSLPRAGNVHRYRRPAPGSVFAVLGSRGRGPSNPFAMRTRGIRYAGPPPYDCDRDCSFATLVTKVSYLGDVDHDWRDDLFIYSSSGDRGYVVLSR